MLIANLHLRNRGNNLNYYLNVLQIKIRLCAYKVLRRQKGKKSNDKNTVNCSKVQIKKNRYKYRPREKIINRKGKQRNTKKKKTFHLKKYIQYRRMRRH